MAQEDNSQEQSENQQSMKLDVVTKVQMNYLLYLPDDYESKESWPLLLFLHGAGERGDDLELVKVHGPPKLIAAGKEFPFIVVSPQCPSNSWWQPVRLATLLDKICEEHRVDHSRIYVTGLSMGGFGTWSLTNYQPERFAAIAPICGGGEPFWARSFKDTAAWAFHGSDDRLIPVVRSEQMIEALKRAGGDAKLTVYEGVGHDSWTATYDDPEFYEWLLSHQREEK